MNRIIYILVALLITSVHGRSVFAEPTINTKEIEKHIHWLVLDDGEVNGIAHRYLVKVGKPAGKMIIRHIFEQPEKFFTTATEHPSRWLYATQSNAASVLAEMGYTKALPTLRDAYKKDRPKYLKVVLAQSIQILERIKSKDNPHFKVVDPHVQPAEAQPPELKDCVHIRKEKDRTVFDVICKTPIGGAKIVLVDGSWPERIVVHLHLRALEGFSVSYNKRRINIVRTNLDVAAYDNEGKLFKGKYLLKKRGYYEVKLPVALFDKETREITISWLEFALQ